MSTATAAPRSAPSMILIADDDEEVLARLTTRIHRYDPKVEVVTAMDGEEALRIITTQHPRVALLDHRMPKMSGVEVARNAGLNGTACIVVSSEPPLSKCAELTVRSKDDVEGEIANILAHPDAYKWRAPNRRRNGTLPRVQRAVGG